MVRPLPFMKRCTRPTSKVGTTPATPPWMRQDLAVVPPMSKQNISGRLNKRLKYSPAITAAVGPDSMMRTGNSAAVSAEVTPPLEREFVRRICKRVEQAHGDGLHAQALQRAHRLSRF